MAGYWPSFFSCVYLSERRIQGGIRWLSKELRGGSAVIDKRKGAIRPNNCSCCSGSMGEDVGGGGGDHDIFHYR